MSQLNDNQMPTGSLVFNKDHWTQPADTTTTSESSGTQCFKIRYAYVIIIYIYFFLISKIIILNPYLSYKQNPFLNRKFQMDKLVGNIFRIENGLDSTFFLPCIFSDTHVFVGLPKVIILTYRKNVR